MCSRFSVDLPSDATILIGKEQFGRAGMIEQCFLQRGDLVKAEGQARIRQREFEQAVNFASLFKGVVRRLALAVRM